jgi:hypothetical protein
MTESPGLLIRIIQIHQKFTTIAILFFVVQEKVLH